MPKAKNASSAAKPKTGVKGKAKAEANKSGNDGKTSATPAAAHLPVVTARFYCQGIGDCHLLKFPKADGGEFRILIDCGVHSSVTGGNDYVDRIVDDLLSACGKDKHIDVVVATHEHWDHNSGFYTAAEKFRQFTIGEIWMGWTENPADDQARRLDKFKGQAIATLTDVTRRLGSVPQSDEMLHAVSEGIRTLAGFNFGLKGEKVRSARDAIVALAPNKVRYLEPANPPVTLPGVPNVRVYFLGPPRDEKLLGIRERTDEMYGVGSVGWPTGQALAWALDADAGDSEGPGLARPFESTLGSPFAAALNQAAQEALPGEPPEVSLVRQSYLQDAWRRVDNDWLAASAELAMQLDDRTNNTSLVLAFEFIDTGRVMLFAADAQVGSWLSWQNTKWTVGQNAVTGPDLLARTIFYKVGHHGSQNATLKAKGLELMTSQDLAAFFPTNKKDAVKVKWGEMPFEPILEDLERRTNGRVVRADDPWVATSQMNLNFTPPSGSIQAVRHEQDLWVEFDIR